MCSIDDVCAAAAKLLQTGGRLCVCQRPERLLDVLESMRAHKIEPKRVRFVQKRGDTAPWLFLAEGHKGGRRFLKVEPPLLIQDEKGGFSPELQRIYRLTPNYQNRNEDQHGWIFICGRHADRQPGGHERARGAHPAGGGLHRRRGHPGDLKLLNHFAIKKPMLSYHEHNARRRAAKS